jgi:molybdenum cofactor synthesis domain-containing protein
MEVAILTVGDEILSGDTENTNATWLARQLRDRGASARRILTVPDDRGVIADYVREWSEAFDAVVVTGGLGGTPDDVTAEAVADALDRDLVVQDDVRETVAEKARQFREDNPDLAEGYDFDIDLDTQAALPDGAEPLITDASFAPGCAVENVFVFPGFPEELKAMFALVAEDFGGDAVSETLTTPAPEGALYAALEDIRGKFDVTVGSYPVKGRDPGRVKVTGTDAEAVEAAVAWLREEIEVVGE